MDQSRIRFHLDGGDLLPFPVEQRKDRLRGVLGPGERIGMETSSQTDASHCGAGTAPSARALGRSLGRYLGTGALVGLVTIAGIPLRTHLADPDVIMLYMLAIGASAVMFGRGPSIVASALSVLAFDFFFVSPFHTFAIANERYLLTLTMMFVVACSPAVSR
jgi:two-component system, OmpR family, sensor histidine kinase KdpD